MEEESRKREESIKIVRKMTRVAYDIESMGLNPHDFLRTSNYYTHEEISNANRDSGTIMLIEVVLDDDLKVDLLGTDLSKSTDEPTVTIATREYYSIFVDIVRTIVSANFPINEKNLINRKAGGSDFSRILKHDRDVTDVHNLLKYMWEPHQFNNLLGMSTDFNVEEPDFFLKRFTNAIEEVTSDRNSLVELLDSSVFYHGNKEIIRKADTDEYIITFELLLLGMMSNNDTVFNNISKYPDIVARLLLNLLKTDGSFINERIRDIRLLYRLPNNIIRLLIHNMKDVKKLILENELLGKKISKNTTNNIKQITEGLNGVHPKYGMVLTVA